MLRTSTNILPNIWGNSSNITNLPFQAFCIRWRRKPRWVPTAKSKIFRVPEKKRLPEEERIELLRLHNNYKTQMRAVRNFLFNEIMSAKKSTSKDAAHMTADEEVEDFNICFRENDIWNKAVAEIREIRLAKRADLQKEIILAKIAEQDNLKIKDLQENEIRVRNEMEKVKTFITRETLDSAIETALANPVDYNFSIDLSGNLYKGREAIPESVRKTDPVKTADVQ